MRFFLSDPFLNAKKITCKRIFRTQWCLRTTICREFTNSGYFILRISINVHSHHVCHPFFPLQFLNLSFQSNTALATGARIHCIKQTCSRSSTLSLVNPIPSLINPITRQPHPITYQPHRSSTPSHHLSTPSLVNPIGAIARQPHPITHQPYRSSTPSLINPITHQPHHPCEVNPPITNYTEPTVSVSTNKKYSSIVISPSPSLPITVTAHRMYFPLLSLPSY